MHTRTKNRIEFLQKYLQKKYLKWQQIHPNNIVGFRIDKKISKENPKGNYSIIFQVKKKKDKNRLAQNETIPPVLLIKFPDGKKRKIKTDVQETGRPKFQLSECRKPMLNGKTEVGTAGVVLKDGIQHFALTNYHVAAGDRMRRGQFRFKGQDNNIFVDGNREVFTDGIISREIDIAFILLSNIPFIPNRLGEGLQINGFLKGPLSAGLMGREVMVYSSRMRRGKKATIKTNSAPVTFSMGSQNFSLESLVQITKVTVGGDSGGPVLIDNDILLGIVVGADDKSTYIIPFFRINNFKPLSIA